MVPAMPEGRAPWTKPARASGGRRASVVTHRGRLCARAKDVLAGLSD